MNRFYIDGGYIPDDDPVQTFINKEQLRQFLDSLDEDEEVFFELENMGDGEFVAAFRTNYGDE